MASSPHFFKMILQSALTDRKLMIPKRFIRNYCKDLSSPVYLKLPNGEEWRVGLTTSDGLIWLQNGWHKFAEHHSLEFGSLLVFRYDGNSIFHTKIFKKTGLEIEYPCNDGTHRHESSIDDDFEADDSPKKNDKTSFTKEEGSSLAQEAAKESLPKNPSFVYVVRPLTYKHARLNVPLTFGSEHFSPEMETVKLQVRDKQWKVKLIQSRGRFRFSAGWRAFSKQNSLEAGDKCMFEMISKKDCVFKVTIFKQLALLKWM